MRDIFRYYRKRVREGGKLYKRTVYGVAVCLGTIAGAVLAHSSGFGGQIQATPGEQAYILPTPISSAGKTSPINEAIGPVASDSLRPLPAMRDFGGRPKIVIIFDDIGLDASAYTQLSRLPRPLTFSILPYAQDAEALAGDAKRKGHDVFLHLPMQPASNVTNAGPGALLVEDSPRVIRQKIARNLDSFSGYAGVNNHMGSLFTQDRQKMLIVLSEIDLRGYYFVDSVTSGRSVAATVAAELGLTILSRDVFLDSDYTNLSARIVRERLGELEAIAQNRGYAIAIAHPYDTTIETIRPWLVSLEMRGFELVTVADLLEDKMPPETLSATALR